MQKTSQVYQYALMGRSSGTRETSLAFSSDFAVTSFFEEELLLCHNTVHPLKNKAAATKAAEITPKKITPQRLALAFPFIVLSFSLVFSGVEDLFKSATGAACTAFSEASGRGRNRITVNNDGGHLLLSSCRCMIAWRRLS